MNAKKLGGPPDDIRTEWRRLDDLVDDVARITKVTSSHPHLVSVDVNEGGIVFDFSGLVEALSIVTGQKF
jgi:hypothetical protein